ncbi:MAG: DUF2603 domain-containing protein [Campylobacteraceae bacterium]|jgi:hypothetical protein|nr:DUF2603 domain-containing protein [Campylobacteraceae bacterium]
MSEKKGELAIYEKIDSASKSIGLDSSKTAVLRVKTTDNPDIKEVHLTSGSWDDEEPWFVIDENEKIHTLISIDTLTNVIKDLNLTQQENFNLKLERTIWQHLPIDFGDVWVVAMDELKNMAKQSDKATAVKLDIEKLVLDIKKKHPSLFVDINTIHNNMIRLKSNELN